MINWYNIWTCSDLGYNNKSKFAYIQNVGYLNEQDIQES